MTIAVRDRHCPIAPGLRLDFDRPEREEKDPGSLGFARDDTNTQNSLGMTGRKRAALVSYMDPARVQG